jgi:hypothetical protein
MAAPSVTAEMTEVTDAETDTNWTGGNQEDVAIQGTYSVGYRVSKTTRHIYYDYSGTGSFNFAVGQADEGKHIYVWANCLSVSALNTIANGGISIRVGDGSNYGLWYVGGYSNGGQNYDGGWKCFVVSPNRQFDAVSGTWTTSGNPGQLTAVDEFGVYFNVADSASGTNCFVDAIRVGTGLRIEDGEVGTPATWDALFAADDLNANKYGVIRKISNTFFVQGKVFIGHDTGSTTTYFDDSDKVVIFENNIHPTDSSLFVDSDFYEIKVENNTTVIMGDVAGSGQDSAGISGVTLRGQPTLKYKLDVTDPNTDALKLYALQSANSAEILLGNDDGYALDGYIELVDCSFSTSDRIALNFDTTPLLLRNTTISSEELTEAAIQLIEPDTLDGDEFTSLLSDGYAFSSEDDAAVETIQLSNHTLTTNTGYIRVYENKTWNVVNPVWDPSLGSMEDLNFDDSSGKVNEKFSLDLAVQEPDGTPINGATTYVFEGLVNDNLPTANRQVTVSGLASSNILKRAITWSGAGESLDSVTYGNFALRVYKYTKTPFIGALSVAAAINQAVTLIADTAITEATQATAISNGAGITVTFHRTGESDPRPMKVLGYDGGTGLFVATETVTGAGGGSGTILEVVGDVTSGVLVVEGWNGTEFINDEALTGDVAGVATADLSGGGSSFYEEYTVEVDGNSLALTTTYDYLAARMAEDPITSAYEEVIIWGESEQSQLLYSGASGFFTERNVSNTEGVWVANRGAGTVAYMTADDGTQYIPPVQYTFSLTSLKSNSEVRIYQTSDDTELAGTETSTTSFSYNYIYGGDVGVYVVVFHLNWIPIRLVGLTLSNSNQSIPIQQQTDRVYSNP